MSRVEEIVMSTLRDIVERRIRIGRDCGFRNSLEFLREFNTGSFLEA